MLSIILPIFCHFCFPFWTKGPFLQVDFLSRHCCEWMRAGRTTVDRNQSDLSLKSCSPPETPLTPPLFLLFILKCFFPICATPVLPLSSQLATKAFLAFHIASKQKQIHSWPGRGKKKILQGETFVIPICSSWSVHLAHLEVIRVCFKEQSTTILWRGGSMVNPQKRHLQRCFRVVKQDIGKREKKIDPV